MAWLVRSALIVLALSRSTASAGGAGGGARNWREGIIAAIQRPVERTDPSQRHDPVFGVDVLTNSPPGSVKPPYPLYGVRNARLWLYAIEAEGRRYVGGAEEPARKGFLRSLSVGSKVTFAVDRGSLYLRDAARKEHRLRELTARFDDLQQRK